MPITRAQLDAAAEALSLVLKFDRPADTRLGEFFRLHRTLGSNDRAFIADAVYGVLRRKRSVEHLVPDGAPRRVLLGYLVRVSGISVRELAAATTQGEQAWLSEVKAARLDGQPLSIHAELPDWIAERLSRQRTESELLELARGLNEPAPLDLRINTMRVERDEALQILVRDGFAAAPTPYSPTGVRVKGRPAINKHPLFANGSIEVQDEGSQLLCHLVAPRRHELVVDFCAGAGGKSLALGALMRSRGRLYAFDVSAARLDRLKPRLKRSGLSNLYPHAIGNENDLRIKRLAGKIDRVLVDAPCSGLGTLRRNPDLKWRQSPRSVEELRVKQAAILRAAANLLKPGGRLVYATCSLLAEENESVVSDFLSERKDFSMLDCSKLLHEARVPLDTGTHFRVFPHIHGTDGFFAAAMLRG